MYLVPRDSPPATEEEIAARLRSTKDFVLGALMSAVLIDTFLW